MAKHLTKKKTAQNDNNLMTNPIPDHRIEIPLAGGGTIVIATGDQSLFEAITNDLLDNAEHILALMRKHVEKDYANEAFRRVWAAPPIQGKEGDLLGSLLWVIGHEREHMFAQMTKQNTTVP